MALGFNKAGSREYGQVAGHRVLRHLETARYFAGGQALRFMLHQEAERIETGALRQSSKDIDSLSRFHISNIIDSTVRVNYAGFQPAVS